MFDDESHLYFECGELGYECSAILKIPRIPRISIVLSRCKKKEEQKCGAPFVQILFRANPCLFSLFVNNGQPSKIYL